MTTATEQEPVNCTASELSTFLQALAAGFLPTFYSGTSQSGPLSSIRIASKSWRNGKKTGSFPGFQSLPMSKSLTGGPGEDSSMSSPVDSPAKTSASQEGAQESTENAPDSGATWRGSLARYDHASRSWKTVQHSFLEDSDESSVTWPRSGTTVAGQCYLLPMSVRRIGGGESGLWLPTPCATDAHPYTGGELFRSRNGTIRARNTDGTSSNRGLSATVEWPTPTVNGNYNKAGLSAKSGDSLATAAVWRTPNTVDSKGGTRNGKGQVQLCHQVRETMATPTARDWRSGKASEATHARNSRPLSEQQGGRSIQIGWSF